LKLPFVACTLCVSLHGAALGNWFPPLCASKIAKVIVKVPLRALPLGSVRRPW
jgi:hypothetical protein